MDVASRTQTDKLLAAGPIATAGQPSATAGMQIFPELTFDATNYIESCCGCFWTFGLIGWTTKTLKLEADEAVLVTRNNCMLELGAETPVRPAGRRGRRQRLPLLLGGQDRPVRGRDCRTVARIWLRSGVDSGGEQRAATAQGGAWQHRPAEGAGGAR